VCRRRAARGEVERGPNGSYDYFSNPINHLSHNTGKSVGKEADRDWSHRDEMEKLIRQAGLLPHDEVIPLARIGRTCGARAGGVTLVRALAIRALRADASCSRAAPDLARSLRAAVCRA
jgi:hypothetical protein